MKQSSKLIIMIVSIGLLTIISFNIVFVYKSLRGNPYDADNGVGSVKSTIVWHLNGYHMTIYGCGNMSEYIPTAWQENLIDLSSGWKIPIRRVIINEGVQSISSCAFSGCKQLVRVDIPNSTMLIGGKAFAYCNDLKNLYYAGTVDEWLSLIHRSPLWNDESSICEVICLDGVWDVNL